jgi:putative DNA primase/helicase
MAVVKQSTEPEDKPKTFTVCGLDEIADTGQNEIVQRLFGPGVVALVGPPNAGKTALGIDVGLSIAARETWFGFKVSGGPVVYFASEAPGSVIMRAKAAAKRKYPERRLPFYIANGTPELGGEVTSLIDAERIIATIRQVETNEGEGAKLVQIDTLASCLGNGDENGDGMIRLVAAAKSIAAVIGCAVMLIHHPSKADSNGLRGHGSLAAACDSIITITMNEVSGVRTATLVKSRDSATGLQFNYTLDPVQLDEPDAFGDPRTTIVVRATQVSQSRPRPTGVRQQSLLADLERRYRGGETFWDEATVRKAGRDLGMPRNSPADALKGLIKAGYVVGESSHLVLKFPPDEAA